MKIINGFILILGVFFSTVNAGSITLKQTASASILGNSLSVALTLINEGDMSAINVTSRVIMVGENISLPTISELKAGQSYSQTTSTSLGNKIHGEYHILSLTAYDDDKGVRHENSAQMYLNSVPINEHPISLGLIVESYEKTESRLTFIINNRAKEDVLVKLQFIVPDGIATNRLKERTRISSLTEKKVPIILNTVDFESMDVSTIYLIARYSINSVEHSQLISAPINPEKEKSMIELFFSNETLLFGFLALFILILFFTVNINIRRKSK